MMGQLPGGQQRLFYAFNLEEHVPAQHLLRSIDQCLDLSDLRAHLADFYSPIGRPSIDPELMVRMLVVGYCYGIRSERRLCEEVHLNLAYRWFCRLGLEDEVPNHSTFSKNRHGRFRDSDLFRWLFNEVLRRCMAAGLVKGEGFAVDASIIKADASRQRGEVGDEVDWRDPALSTRAVREYLEALDEEALAEALPKKISLTDPQSRWTAAPGGPAYFAYATNYLIDTAHGVILDVEATPAHRTAEVESTRTMVERVEAQFDLTPERLIGDTAYGTAPMLAWLVEEKDIEPHVPVVAELLDSLTPRAANQARALLIDIFNHAASKGLCPDNPAASTIAKIEKKQRKRHTVEGLRAIREKAPAWLQNAIDLALITAQRRTDILAMRFDDVRDGHLYVVQQKTAKASDAAWIRFAVTPQLQAVLGRCRDNVPSPFLIHRRPERKRQKQAEQKEHWTKIEERYLTRAFKDARDAAGCYTGWKDEEQPGFHEIRALSLHLYKKAGKDGQKIAGHASEEMTRNYQRDHAEVVWADAVPDLDIAEIAG